MGTLAGGRCPVRPTSDTASAIHGAAPKSQPTAARAGPAGQHHAQDARQPEAALDAELQPIAPELPGAGEDAT